MSTKNKNAVIVESPGKIKKIQSILGNDYIILASVGHIMDLEKKHMSIDLNKFEPSYAKLSDKTSVISKLKQAIKNSKDLYIATDKDREGEMIAWSIAYLFKLKEPKRIIFNSITKKELQNAIKNPTKINMDMVYAQQARRMLDRIVGYKLSPILWRKLNSKSAGRVQSVVVKLIIDKENEIQEFLEKNDNSFFRINSTFKNDEKDNEKNIDNIKSTLHTLSKNKLTQTKISSYDDTLKLFKNIIKSSFFIEKIDKSISYSKPAPPFTTSTLQQETYNKLGYSSKKTMIIAQKLYEKGLITYMRTDSTNLSDAALYDIKDYVNKNYGDKYYHFRKYSNKKGNTQEAHEAIRPTKISLDKLSKEKYESSYVNLYKLIWRRTVASQMEAAKYDVYDAQINISKLEKYKFLTNYKKLVFYGYLILYEDNYKLKNKNDELLSLKKNMVLTLNTLESNEEWQKPSTRYSEASLIKKLDPKNLNIGRPATYSSIISKIVDRNYIKKDDVDGKELDSKKLLWNNESNKIETKNNKIKLGFEKNKFVPTELGKATNDFLIEKFNIIMDYNFTAKMEDELDEIANCKKKRYQVMNEFYSKFEPCLKSITFDNNDNNYFDKFKVSLGKHPDNNKEIIKTKARYGSIVKMIGGNNDKDKIASIDEPYKYDNITLNQAIKLLSFPKYIDKYDDKDIYINKGKYGLYITYDGQNYNISGDKSKMNITKEEAIKIIKEKDKNMVAKFNDKTYTYLILNGKYGYYINAKSKSKKLNVPIKDKVYDTSKINEIKLEDIKKIIKSYNEYKKNNKNNYSKKKYASTSNYKKNKNKK